MAEAPAPRDKPGRIQLIDAIVLAFSRSPLKEVVGTDALRTVLGPAYVDIVQGNVIDLQVVWDMLEGQPGFTPPKAMPACALLKSWEAYLAHEVHLPKVMTGVAQGERTAMAGVCSAKLDDLLKLLRDTPQARTPSPSIPPPQAPRNSGGVSIADVSPLDNYSPRQRKLLIGLFVVGVLGIGASSVVLVRACSGPTWKEVHAAEFAGTIPLKDAHRLGGQVGATVADPAWLRKPDDERRVEMENALRKLSDRDVEVLFVMDATGRVRASAQWTNGKIITRFL